MSDLERFKPELQPRLVFARHVAQMRERLLAPALASLSLSEFEKQWLTDRGDVYYLGIETQRLLPYSKQSPKFPTRLWGADEVSLGLLGKGHYEDEAEESVGMFVHLYRGGQPYIPDEIIDEVLDPSHHFEPYYEKNRFLVTASHEGPPAMVHTFYAGLYASEAMYAPEAMLVGIKNARPDVIHYLDDNECSSIMTIVESAAPFVDSEALEHVAEYLLRA